MEKVVSYSKRLASAGEGGRVGNMLVSKVGRVGLAVGWQWQRWYWIELGGRAGKSGMVGPLVTQPDSPPNTAQILRVGWLATGHPTTLLTQLKSPGQWDKFNF